MSTEKTHLKNDTQAGDSNPIDEMAIEKNNIYRHTFFIVASSLLALLVLVVVAGNRGDQDLASFAHKMEIGAGAIDGKTSNSDLMLDIVGTMSEQEVGCTQIGEDMYDNNTGGKVQCCSGGHQVMNYGKYFCKDTTCSSYGPDRCFSCCIWRCGDCSHH